MDEIKKQSEDFIKTVSDSPKKSQTENTAVKEDEKKQKDVKPSRADAGRTPIDSQGYHLLKSTI